MATWQVPDELDARLRKRLGSGDVTGFVERLIRDLLDYETDPDFQAEVTASIRQGMADADAGRVRDAREVMRELADKHGLSQPGECAIASSIPSH